MVKTPVRRIQTPGTIVHVRGRWHSDMVFILAGRCRWGVDGEDRIVPVFMMENCLEDGYFGLSLTITIPKVVIDSQELGEELKLQNS